MKKALPILALGILACMALYVAWQLSAPAATQPVAKPAAEKKEASSKPTQAISLIPPAKQSPHSPETAQALLNDFYLTGNKDALKKAQELHPTNPDVIMVSCLETMDADSPFLAALEKLQPNNALPNLIRAGLYARQGILENFPEEIEKALSKSQINQGGRERMNYLLDLLINQGITKDSLLIVTQPYGKLYELIQDVHNVFVDHPSLFNDDVTTLSVGLKLAEQWRQLQREEEVFPMFGNLLEMKLLELVDPAVSYRIGGVTVAERKDVVKAELYREWKTWLAMRPFFFEEANNVVLIKQFAIQMRQNGFSGALEWASKVPALTRHKAGESIRPPFEKP